jgi:hypothetical protein
MAWRLDFRNTCLGSRVGVFVIVFSLRVALRPLVSSAQRRAVPRSDGAALHRADDVVGRCVAVQL